MILKYFNKNQNDSFVLEKNKIKKIKAKCDLFARNVWIMYTIMLFR